MRFAPFLILAAFTTPAAAHDATLAYVEAMEVHLLDCPSVNGYVPGGDVLSTDWVARNAEDTLLDRHEVEFRTKDGILNSNVNIFTKTVEDMELIQFMAIRTIEAEEGAPALYVEGEGNIAATEYFCVTMVPDLPFMPSGQLLGAVFGKDPDTGIGNWPGDHRDGSWIWDNVSPEHIRTIARYTNSFSDKSDMPEGLFYPGFYMMSFRRFTPENSPEISNEESDQ